MRKLRSVHVLWGLLFILFLVGCGDDHLTNGDQHISEEMHAFISDYIIQENASNHSSTEKQFEVHKIYGTSEEDGVISVYVKSFSAGFNRATGLQEQSGMVIPVLLRISEMDGTYTVTDYVETIDGSYWESSLKEMFPKKYYRKVLRNSGASDLQKQMDQKVKKWLEEEA